MIRGRRRLDAYRDGAMPPRARRRFERELERSPELSVEIARRDALGRLLREAWSDGPEAPSPEYLISAVRPQLARIDRERTEEPAWRQAWQGLRRFVSPVPATALAGAALILLVVLARPEPTADLWATSTAFDSSPLGTLETGMPAAESEGLQAFSVGMPSAVYDVAQGESPLMLFEAADGTVVFWLIDEEQEISSLSWPSEGRA